MRILMNPENPAEVVLTDEAVGNFDRDVEVVQGRRLDCEVSEIDITWKRHRKSERNRIELDIINVPN